MISKALAAVQSSYIPWKGYFDLINMADEFILYDDAQYTKRDWRNRNVIKCPKGTQWLTIPVKVKGRYTQKVCETLIDDPDWGRRHWRAISHNYSKAKFFSEYRGIFEPLYLNSKEESLSRVNYTFIAAICRVLGIDTKISWSMDYAPEGKKTAGLVDLCKKAGAAEYISGPSARDYIEEGEFAKEGISLSYMDYSGYPEYDQLFAPFEHHVSILDLIFNEGPNAPKFMKTQKS